MPSFLNMCGIGFYIHGSRAIVVQTNDGENSEELEELFLPFEAEDVSLQKSDLQDLLQTLSRRGPDSIAVENVYVDADCSDGFDFLVIGSVLHLKGNFTPQPVGEKKRGYLVWNGEIYSNLESKFACKVGENDTVVVSSVLQRLLCESNCDANILASELCSIHSFPWSFIFWDQVNKKLWFARDPLGRRSLVCRSAACDGENSLVISSACGFGAPQEWKEIPPTGVFSLSFIKDSIVLDHTIWPVLSPLAMVGSTPLPCDFDKDAPQGLFLESLKQSIWKRVVDIPFHRPADQQTGSSSSDYSDSTSARVGVLFSGGIDSVLLAGILDIVLSASEVVDLINVSFAATQDPKSVHEKKSNITGSSFEECHDREAAMHAYNELVACTSSTRFRLVLCEITRDEAILCKNHVLRCCAPLKSVLDFDLAVALWFAAAGRGKYYLPSAEQPCDRPFQSSARVLLSGLGADESCGGYARHRRAFESGGFTALRNEMDFDLNRLWKRNLGRDDRVISSHGKEVRYPFLDSEVLSVARSLVTTAMNNDATGDEGSGEAVKPVYEDKWVIRDSARSLGLNVSACRAKKAMQFGTRSAQMKLHGLKLPRSGASEVVVEMDKVSDGEHECWYCKSVPSSFSKFLEENAL